MNILGSVTECCDQPMAKQVESPNLLETFKRKKLNLQQRMDDVDAVIVALEKNPEFNTLIELITKAR